MIWKAIRRIPTFCPGREINRLLEQDDVPFAAQPIVCRDGSLYGYELLMRPETRNFKNIQEVLNLAKRQAKLPQFERLTWVGALRWLFTHKAEIPSDCHILSIPLPMYL
ncbi:MAG: hypothetical protein V8S58_14445 [Lachnospiraceae bacterium]